MRTVRIVILAVATLLVVPGSVPAEHDTTIHDKDIKVIDVADLSYPALAHAAHIQGVVVVRVKLDERGRVAEAEAISGDELLIHASVDNAKKWRFDPNSQKTAIIVYNFRIEGLCPADGAYSQMVFYPRNLVAITGCARPLSN